MTDLRKPQGKLIFDLIDEANPGFSNNLVQADVKFGTPATQAVPSGGIADTNVKVSGVPSGKLIGSKPVQYRRVDLTKLFRGQTVIVTKWLAGTTLSRAQFVEYINAMYGLSLLETDITALTWTEGTARSAVIVAGSLCYKGTITFQWAKGKRDLKELVPDGILAGRLWPNGNDFSVGRKPQGEFESYGFDCSAIAATLNPWATTGSLAVGGAGNAILANHLNSQMPGSQWTDAAHTAARGLGGTTYTKYTLPNAAIPEANSAKYNRCIVIPAQGTSWFQGKLIFHWNA